MHDELPIPTPRDDRRRGARLVAGLRIRVGVREHRPHDGWMLWTPEARERALHVAATAYLGDHRLPLAEAERRSGIPRGLLAPYLRSHPVLLSMEEPVRLARAALEVRLYACAPHIASHRWRVDSARVSAESAALSNPLYMTRLLQRLKTAS